MRGSSPERSAATSTPEADLFAALPRLDALFASAVRRMQAAGETAADDPYRGLHVSAGEAERLLERAPGSPTLWEARAAAEPLAVLQRMAADCELTGFDLDAILIALAPEVDLRYERLCGYLQDDVTRRQPSVELILNLLCPDAAARLAARSHFAADAPLLRHRLLHLHADPSRPNAPLLAHAVSLDDPVVQRLLGPAHLDRRLAACCRIVEARLAFDALQLPRATAKALRALASRGPGPLPALYFHGRDGTGKCSAAEALARSIEAPMLALDLGRSAAAGLEPVHALERALREARWRDALLFVEGLGALSAEHRGELRRVFDAASKLPPRALVLAGAERGWPGAQGLPELIEVAFDIPDVLQRRACWQACLGPPPDNERALDLDLLAQRFRLSPGQIAAAVAQARGQATWAAAAGGFREAAGRMPSRSALVAAARAQTGQRLAELARKVDSPYAWSDLVLPDDARAQLEEICARSTHRHVVHGAWGFERKLSLGKGLNCLFSGPPGTGKTMAAEVIANELQLDLYKIDLSRVVSKYIGETEKNLDRIFSAAEDANAILFFDEADALFGKRSETKDAHDRYANIEVGYLLQKMEEYAGIAILATNLKQHLDQAFLRRLQAIVEFPLPDEEHRRRIWQGVFPSEAPLGDDVDFALLARAVRMPGGNIRNIGLASAFFAASDGGVIRMPHVARAVRREHQKLGRSWNDWTDP